MERIVEYRPRLTYWPLPMPTPQILLVSPPPLVRRRPMPIPVGDVRRGDCSNRRKLRGPLRRCWPSSLQGAASPMPALWPKTTPLDGVHLDAENTRAIGTGLALGGAQDARDRTGTGLMRIAVSPLLHWLWRCGFDRSWLCSRGTAHSRQYPRGNFARLQLCRHGLHPLIAAVTLVGRRAALAMRYCLSEVPINAVHLLFGYDRAAWVAHLKIASMHADRDHADLSLLCLDADAPATSTPFALGHFPRGRRCSHCGRLPAPAKPSPDDEILQCRDARGRRRFFPIDCSIGAGGGAVPSLSSTERPRHFSGVVAEVSDRDSLVYRWTGDTPDKICSPNINSERWSHGQILRHHRHRRRPRRLRRRDPRRAARPQDGDRRREHLGGICFNWGCIPTKALLRSAETFAYMQHAKDYGLSAEQRRLRPGRRRQALARRLRAA